MRKTLQQPPKHPAARLVVYYGALVGVVYLLGTLFPSLLELATAPPAPLVDLRDAFGPVAQAPAAPRGPWDMLPLAAGLLAALTLSLPVSWTYMGARSRRGFDSSVVQTIVILPIAVVGITNIVQHSIALAFSLAGIAAGVRFRNALKDTSDALYIFAAIGIGLAAGTGQLATAFLVSAFFNLANLMFWNPAVTEPRDTRQGDEPVLEAVHGSKGRKARRRKAATLAPAASEREAHEAAEPARQSAGS